jgi:murein DD-endopeptidase MepM/ murein hydrolase activator NlpD
MRSLTSLPGVTITAAALLAAVVTTPAHAATADVLGEVPAPPTTAPSTLDVAPVPDVRQLNVSRHAISPNGDGSGDRLVVSFTLPPASAAASARVVDERGDTVRLLGQFAPGDERVGVAWTGVDEDGATVPDGRYRIVVAPALSDAAVAMSVAPQSTADAVVVSDVVRVDRRAPRVGLVSHSVRAPSRSTRTISVPLFASERATVRIAAKSAIGTSRRTAERAAGRSIVRIPVRGRRALSRAFDSGGAARVSMRIAVHDEAGNRATRTVSLDVLPPASEQLTWPMHAAVTSGFGSRWGRLHAGIDMPTPVGTPIHAAGPGRVVSAGSDGGYGNSVVIDHGPTETRYAHQSRLLVHVGQRVTRGQLIGYSGNTGSSTGAHLHFEVHVNGVPRDPMAYLP